MEKADILENVLRYIKHTSEQEKTENVNIGSTGSNTSPKSPSYRQGYEQCMQEVTKIMDGICDKQSTSDNLQHHMNNKVNTMNSNVVNIRTSTPIPIKQEKGRVVSLPGVDNATSFLPIIIRPEQYTRTAGYNRNFGYTLDSSVFSPISPIYVNTSYDNIKREKKLFATNGGISVTSTPKRKLLQTLKVVPDSTSNRFNVHDNLLAISNEDITPKIYSHNVNVQNNEIKSAWRPW